MMIASGTAKVTIPAMVGLRVLKGLSSLRAYAGGA
jgi:hypothetical protein